MHRRNYTEITEEDMQSTIEKEKVDFEDEIYNLYRFTPMKVEIEEHHVGVYKSKKDNHFKKVNHKMVSWMSLVGG